MNDPHTASGNRFIAGLFGLPCLTLPLALINANIPSHHGSLFFISDLGLLLSLFGGFALGWHLGAIRGDRRWKLLGTTSFVVSGAAYGLSMEGAEGALWGSLIGVIPGFFYGLYAPWIAWIIPSRSGAIAAWSILGILLFVVPVLTTLRLYDGKFDGDQIPYVVVAAVFGIRHASRRGWWRSGEILPAAVFLVLGKRDLYFLIAALTACLLAVYFLADTFFPS